MPEANVALVPQLRMLARAKQLARRRGAAVGGCGMIFSEVRLHIVWTPLTGDHANARKRFAEGSTHYRKRYMAKP